jgi:hypothetical protein
VYWLAAPELGHAAQTTACGTVVLLAGLVMPTASSAGAEQSWR